MKIPFINLKEQYLRSKNEITLRINNVLEHGQYIMGPEVLELEKKLENFTKSKHCITVSSGTDALYLSLLSLDIGKGDEVITSPFTFAATIESIIQVGAKPIFADVEPETCNINVSLIEDLISDRTKAIIPVSLYGQPADFKELYNISKKFNNISIIEDASQSFGALYNGKKSCNLSQIGCTSFFPSKPLGCFGDGGAIFTNDANIANACREIRIHGQSKRYNHKRFGINARMDTLQCAILLAKFEKFEWEIEQRIIKGNYYNKMLDKKGIKRVQQRKDRTSVFAQYTIFSDNREVIIQKLKNKGIPTSVHYPKPINEQIAYSVFNQRNTPVASEISKKVLSLPMCPYLNKNDQDKIISFL